MVNSRLTALRQTAEILQTGLGITMYEFRGATLQAAVDQALRYPALSTKKLARVASQFDFTARMRAGSVLFAGEGNLSVTSRKVVWLFPEQLWPEFVPILHRLQGRFAAEARQSLEALGIPVGLDM
jgi:hypothetical protein